LRASASFYAGGLAATVELAKRTTITRDAPGTQNYNGIVERELCLAPQRNRRLMSKRGDRYLRTLFMQGARVILLRPANWAKHTFWAVADGRGETAVSQRSGN
jgi:hypothetical protein